MNNNIEHDKMENTRQAVYTEKDFSKILNGIDMVIAAKGKKVEQFDLKNKNFDNALFKAMVLGPTGNFRAPAIKKGKKLFVGFNEESYKQYL